jgi:hypothetical protein
MGFNKNPFSEEDIVADIYLALDQKNYQELFQILNRLPTFEPIIDLYLSFVEELRKHTYTMQQLWTIAQLLYRLSNFNFVDVESPRTFPSHLFSSIANISRNKELKNSKIDIKIKEIVKNLIKHYNIDLKSYKNNNTTTNTGRLTLKLKNILYNFIIDYTRPESSEPLVAQSLFPPGATIANRTRYFEEHPEMMARIIGSKPINKK